MFDYIFVKYLHLLLILIMVSAVVSELILVKNELTRSEIKFLAKLDTIYGIASILVVAMGLTLWFGVGKPSSYYMENGIFHIKVALAIIVGVLSIVPTVFFLKNRKGDDEDILIVPKKVKTFIVLELLVLAIIPLLAVLMANGIGHSS